MPEALASTPSMGHKIKLPVKQRPKEPQSAEANNLKSEEGASTYLTALTHWPKEDPEAEADRGRST